MRLILTLVALLAATPASANPACLAAPTQDCVFQMAVAQALARPQIEDQMQGLAEVALWQEAAGRDDWADTIGLLPQILSAEPDPILIGLTFATMPLAMANRSDVGPYLSPTTRTFWRLGDDVTEFVTKSVGADPEGDAGAVLFDLGVTGDLPGIVGHIRAADPAQAEAMAEAAAAGLISAGRIEDAFSLLTLVPSLALSGKISRWATLHALSTSGPADAQVLALRFANTDDRIEALFAVAHSWATTGHPDIALAIARDLPPEVWQSEDPADTWLLAEILAARGPASLHVRATHPDRPPILGPDRLLSQVQLIATALTAEGPEALAHVLASPSSVRNSTLKSVLEARWIVQGQAGADEILALLPPEDLPTALAALGQAQVKTGDLSAALATEARISALSRQHPALKTLRQGLAPLLATKGDVAKAVAMAGKLGSPWTTAHVAAALNPVATD